MLKRRFYRSLVAIAALVAGSPTLALDYGIYDARGLSMGGAAVAAANWHSAQYYNAALLAFHNQYEEDTRDGRVILPNLVARADNVAEEIVDAADSELDTRLEQAVAAYNQNPFSETAAEVASVSREMESLLIDLANENVQGDTFVGFSISEPSLMEGGAFYFGVRAMAFADSQIPEADLAFIDSYISALEAVANGSDVSTIPAELFDADGNLVDPSTQLTSTADLSAISISEWAVAMAKQVDFFGQQLALGLTPKIQRVDVFRETTNFDDDELNFSDSQQIYVNLNADIGLAFQFFDAFRVGLAVKDVVPEEFETSNGLLLKLEPRPRMGLAYVNDWVTVGLDMDLAENEPLASEGKRKDLAFGLELSPFRSVDLRFGYQQDMTGLRDDTLSAGIAYQFKRIFTELSYAQSDVSTGVAFQFGWVF